MRPPWLWSTAIAPSGYVVPRTVLLASIPAVSRHVKVCGTGPVAGPLNVTVAPFAMCAENESTSVSSPVLSV